MKYLVGTILCLCILIVAAVVTAGIVQVMPGLVLALLLLAFVVMWK